MKLELIDALKAEDQTTIMNLMQLYTYELSFFEDESTNFQMQNNGLYTISKYIELYWTEAKYNPYILRCNNEIAGFALQRLNEENMYETSEFFIINKYRKRRAGAFMAKEIFKKYKGKWEIRTLLKNQRAQDFWRKVIKDFSNDNYTEKLIRNNSRYAFYFENNQRVIK